MCYWSTEGGVTENKKSYKISCHPQAVLMFPPKQLTDMHGKQEFSKERHVEQVNTFCV